MPDEKAQKEYKDRLFKFLFGSEAHKELTLSLYNAVNHSSYTDSSQIQIVTLDDVLYVSMKNDVGFLLGDELNLYEQQSTWNPNMPLRMLFYAAKELSQYKTENGINLYSSVQRYIPAPKCIVFYNGEDARESTSELLLSRMYKNGQPGDIEVRVTVYNIHRDGSRDLKKNCKPLDEYSWLIDRIYVKRKNMELAKAISEAIDEMPDDFIIASIIKPEKAKVIEMLDTEYDEKKYGELVREDAMLELAVKMLKQGEDFSKIEYYTGMTSAKLKSLMDEMSIVPKKKESSQQDNYAVSEKIAANMLKIGIDPETVAKCTGLAVEGLKDLMKKSK